MVGLTKEVLPGSHQGFLIQGVTTTLQQPPSHLPCTHSSPCHYSHLGSRSDRKMEITSCQASVGKSLNETETSPPPHPLLGPHPTWPPPTPLGPPIASAASLLLTPSRLAVFGGLCTCCPLPQEASPHLSLSPALPRTGTCEPLPLLPCLLLPEGLPQESRSSVSARC